MLILLDLISWRCITGLKTAITIALLLSSVEIIQAASINV